MGLYLKLLAGAIQPRDVFIPMASLIVGTGLSALQWPVDGALFSSCIILVFLGQLALNLASNYQQAFVNNRKDPQTNLHQHALTSQMALRRLSYISAMIFAVLLWLLIKTSVGFSATIALLTVALLVLFATAIRLKTLYSNQQLYSYSKRHLAAYATGNALLPCLISFYLQTAQITDYVLAVAFCVALLALVAGLSKHINEFIKCHPLLNSDNLPPSLITMLVTQFVLLIITIALTTLAIYALNIPWLALIYILALPALFAANITVKHIPEADIAKAQLTKVQLAYFAFWVLFIVGVMIR
ncbi:hypothetical protein QWY77_12040 [Thalassotalea ponticola]|uniref:hypothetical protein n=1 Tax=Thalassotalea ponticola TaxID=1523392 RepID=UPI0025B590CC|nr:hypothetical protein [Thalassotalea ponticola]MDN3653473.1 hypothetical protein [Thalassotalea ponticola]